MRGSCVVKGSCLSGLRLNRGRCLSGAVRLRTPKAAVGVAGVVSWPMVATAHAAA